MRRVVLFIFLVFSTMITYAQNKAIEWADYTPYCGTWQYVNKDTTFTISLKVVTLKRVESSGTITKKALVGGYRLTVKGKFDENHLMTSNIPSVINYKSVSELHTKNYVYIWATGYKNDPDIETCFFSQNKNRRYDFIPGFTMKKLTNGNLQWHWDQKEANSSSWDDPRLPQHIQIPGHAIMTKIK
ncbi:MAG: hypothetical protein MJZ73_02300 [Bacteroidaceae bacterium]|nr:hypothetical protein [Bacteroidaceae bacterium]MCQ2238048.1 hypothetical protein [Bacteroidaceae bacterium]